MTIDEQTIEEIESNEKAIWCFVRITYAPVKGEEPECTSYERLFVGPDLKEGVARVVDTWLCEGGGEEEPQPELNLSDQNSSPV
jgi:hypothetical protein